MYLYASLYITHIHTHNHSTPLPSSHPHKCTHTHTLLIPHQNTPIHASHLTPHTPHLIHAEVLFDEQTGMKHYPFTLEKVPRLHWEDPAADHLMTHEVCDEYISKSSVSSLDCLFNLPHTHPTHSHTHPTHTHTHTHFAFILFMYLILSTSVKEYISKSLVSSLDCLFNLPC